MTIESRGFAPVPHLTTEQRREYQTRAVLARKKRKALRALMKDGSITFERALGSEFAQGMRVYDLLRYVPGVGNKIAVDIMRRCDITLNRRVRGLGCRQRSALLEVFRDVD